jgi:DNA modification methylase
MENDEIQKVNRKKMVQIDLYGTKQVRVGKNGIEMGDRGVYDVRNKLNDLTGREWTYSTLSILETKYPTSGEEGYAHDLRRVHPSPKPPQLMATFINFFTKKDEWVFDPFAGVGGSLIGCSITGRNCIGIELSGKYAEIYRNVCRRENIKPQTIIVDDARNMGKHAEVASHTFKLILTDPPYANMMAIEKSGDDKKRGKSASTPFTTLENDIGNLPYRKFLVELKRILARAVQHLEGGGHLVVFCKDFQPTREYHNMLHCDITEKLAEIDPLTFRGYRIWYDKTLSQYPFGYPYAFVATQIHQFALIFQKKNGKATSE